MNKTYKCYFGKDAVVVSAINTKIAIALAKIERQEHKKSDICTNIIKLDID